MASNLLASGLRLLFCGYNPSLASGRIGYHYANPGNRFWRVLFAAGITDRLYRPEEDAWLLDLGIGFTKIDPPRYNARSKYKFLSASRPWRSRSVRRRSF